MLIFLKKKLNNLKKHLFRLGTLIFLQIIICCIAVTNSEVVRCAFQLKQWDDSVGKVYTCATMNVNFPTSVLVEKAAGRHRANHGNKDVKALDISNQHCEYFPGNFDKSFANLEAIAIVNSKLKSVTKKDLEVFPKLKIINFANNEITALGFSVLSSNPLLMKISFAGNPLVGIGSDLLDNLEALEQVDLSDAGCIDSIGSTEDEIEALRNEISEKCPPTDEMRIIQETNMNYYFCKDQLENSTSNLDVCYSSWEQCTANFEKLSDEQKECESKVEECSAAGTRV
jgi:hypothetical protein